MMMVAIHERVVGETAARGRPAQEQRHEPGAPKNVFEAFTESIYA